MNEKQDVDKRRETSSFFITNMVLTTRIKKLLEENRELQKKVDFHEVNEAHKGVDDEPESANVADTRKKRKRRLKTEVDRAFVCPVEACCKSYG